MAYPIDASKPWYHGSPVIIEVLREGSTITQWKELAEAFAKKPKILGYGEIFGEIVHDGTKEGFLYEVDESIAIDVDVYQHPRTSMDQGVEFLTKRPLKLRQIGRS